MKFPSLPKFDSFKLVRGSVLKQHEDDRKYIQQMIEYWGKRPALDSDMLTDASGAKVKLFPFHPTVLYDIAKQVDIVRIVLQRVREEIFRNGIEVIGKFAYRCNNCGKEFQAMPRIDGGEVACDECGSTDMSRPKPEHRRFLMNLLENVVNQNGQTLIDVLEEIEQDLDIYDYGYLLMLKEYEFNSDGTIKDKIIREIIRGDPLQVFLVADKQARIGYQDVGENQPSKLVLVCPRPEHRQRVLVGEECPECHAKGVKAKAVIKSMYGNIYGSTENLYYYIEGEVVSSSKYWKSLLYGWSPIYTIWIKAMTLYYQDKYQMTYYDKMRTPRGLFIVGTQNLDSFKAAWEQTKKWAEEDPHQIHPLALQTERNGRSIAQFIDLMNNLVDMQYVEARQEMRRSIGAVYGVTPLFEGDVSGGWNNQSLDITVNNRTVSSGQRVLEQEFLDKFSKIVGVKDWVYRLKSAEAMDELRDEQIKAQKFANMEVLKRNGFKVRFTHDDELLYSKVPEEIQTENGSSNKRPTAAQEDMSQFDGQPKIANPTDVGGVAEGHPASGSGTSLSNKSLTGYDFIKSDLQSVGDFDGLIIKSTIEDMRAQAINQAWIGNYEGNTEIASKEIRRVVQLMYQGMLNQDDAINRLSAINDVGREQAELIVKTEFQHMKNRARELAYKKRDKNGTFRYTWDTRDDLQVCPACDEIAYRTKHGVTMDTLKTTILDVARVYGYNGNRMWHVHPRDRCTVMRV